MNIQEFIEKHQLEMEKVKIFDNPNMSDKSWQANHYQIRIKQVGKGNPGAFITFYSQGLGIKTSPKLESVLESLARDINFAPDFKNFCLDFGYSQDSIQALEAFNYCRKIREDMLYFFQGAESVLDQLIGVEF